MPLRIVAAFVRAILGIFIFSALLANTGHHGRFSFAKLFSLVTLAALFIVALKIAIDLSKK